MMRKRFKNSFNTTSFDVESLKKQSQNLAADDGNSYFLYKVVIFYLLKL